MVILKLHLAFERLHSFDGKKALFFKKKKRSKKTKNLMLNFCYSKRYPPSIHEVRLPHLAPDNMADSNHHATHSTPIAECALI